MELPVREPWFPERAEELLGALEAVEAVRLVLGRSGRLDEVHVLATDAVTAKQVVRNVESALFVHFGRSIDHRKISVAQIQSEVPGEKPPPPPPPVAPRPGDRLDERIVLLGHQVTGEASQRVTLKVSIGWRGNTFQGTAHGANVARTRLETCAQATLRAIEAATRSELETQERQPPAFHLDGIAVVGDRDSPTVVVSVTAMNDLKASPLTGAVGLDDDPGRTVILATLRATDRWVRGQLSN